MESKIRFLIYVFSSAACLLTALPAQAQTHGSNSISGKPLIALHPDRSINVHEPLSWRSYLKYMPKTFMTASPPRISGPTYLKPAFSPTDLAFFCRLEYKMERALRFPVKVRLGEVQYVEEMEGKVSSMKINPSHRAYGPR